MAHVRQYHVCPAAGLFSSIASRVIAHPSSPPAARGKALHIVYMTLHRAAHFLQIIYALCSSGFFPKGLHGRNQQRNRTTDYRDGQYQVDICKSQRSRLCMFSALWAGLIVALCEEEGEERSPHFNGARQPTALD